METFSSGRAPRARILLVDDDVETARLLARFLASEYEVTVANDGVEGLAAARTAHPDLIVTDVMMPRLDGFSMVRALRESPQSARVPVIFVTARTRAEDILEGIQAGALHYLTKPIQLDKLAQKVHGALARTSVRPPPPRK